LDGFHQIRACKEVYPCHIDDTHRERRWRSRRRRRSKIVRLLEEDR